MGAPPPNPRDLSHSRQNDGARRQIAPPPLIPAAESALGLRPRSALSSAQVFPEWTTGTSPCNDLSANGDNPLNFVSHSKGSVQFTTRIFKEGRIYVAHALELDVSSCGGTKEKALKNLKDAVRLFLEEAEKMGTLEQILEEAGYGKSNQKIASRSFISVQRVTLPLSLTRVKA